MRQLSGRQGSFLLAAFLVMGAAAGPLGGCGSEDIPFGDTESSGAGVGGGAGGGVVVPPFEPAPAGVRRLVARQYVNTVEALFGASVAAAASPPDDLALHGFTSIGAADIAIPESAVETYETSARAIGEALVADPVALADVFDTSCADGPTQRQCFASFVTSVGKVAWRRRQLPRDPWRRSSASWPFLPASSALACLNEQRPRHRPHGAVGERRL